MGFEITELLYEYSYFVHNDESIKVKVKKKKNEVCIMVLQISIIAYMHVYF